MIGKAGDTVLLMGNEAFARGAYEAGVKVATGYPGTPSTEILENVVKYPGIYSEWSPNEKVALEVAIGAALAGARAIVTMKHVGLNVAADPLMTLSYTGIKGGLVLIVADDPGMYSSQNEQDTRNYGRFAKIPVLEPSDSQEAKDFVKQGLAISETFDTPVIVRSTTRISHTKTVVTLEEPHPSKIEIGFDKDPSKYVPVPANARRMHEKVEVRLQFLEEFANNSDLIVEERKSPELGIITSSTTYQYVKECIPEASVLKLGLAYPLAMNRIRDFAARVKRLIIIEELDPFFETEIKAHGIELEGKTFVPVTGELTPDIVMSVRQQLLGEKLSTDTPARQPLENLPVRAPVLCPGCPHRGLFYALRRLKVVVTGDIGCYSLGYAPPFNRMDTIICMGAAVGVMHGMQKAGVEQNVVGVIGDSTFLHSGITGLMDIVYNKGIGTLVILDNRTTAMTGQQDHPATGKTLMGEKTYEVSFEEIARACGVQRIFTIDPYDINLTIETLKTEIAIKEPSVIIASRPCILLEQQQYKIRVVDQDACTGCLLCVNLGCPAIETIEVEGKKKVRINDILCTGCNMCEQVCPFGAIRVEE